MSNQNFVYFTPEAYKQRENEASSKMGDLMLKGWCMLGSSCDDCNVPLMKSKQGDEICVVCDRNFRKDSKKAIPELIISETKPNPKIEETPKPPPIVELPKAVE
jgi:uncharacterized Zn finger protein (UPF0148 family)